LSAAAPTGGKDRNFLHVERHRRRDLRNIDAARRALIRAGYEDIKI
jgi:hypothetical protein